MGKNSKKKRRARKLTKHHVTNTVNGGLTTPDNIIMLRNEKHQCWHEIFGNLDFLEAANLLIRADRRLKRRCQDGEDR